jgi:carbon storage regulator
MLVLTRKISEVIDVGQDIHVCVLAIGHGQVKLGIDAPVGVSVHRHEVTLRMRDRDVAALDDQTEACP